MPSLTNMAITSTTPVSTRAAMLRRAADAMEQRTPQLCALLVKEAGGLVSDFAGQPGSVWNGQIVAGNEALQGSLRSISLQLSERWTPPAASGCASRWTPRPTARRGSRTAERHRLAILIGKGEVRRDGTEWHQHYELAKPGPLEKVGPTKERGTQITFWADGEIFETTTYSFDTISRRLQEMAFLNKGLTITIRDEREDQEQERDGVAEGVQHLSGRTAASRSTRSGTRRSGRPP